MVDFVELSVKFVMSHHFICSDILCGPASTYDLWDYEIAKVVHKYVTDVTERKRGGGIGVGDGNVNGEWHIRLPEIKIEGVTVTGELIGNANGLSLILYGIDLWMYKKKRLITMDSIVTCKPILYKKTYIGGRAVGEYEVDVYNMVLTKISEDVLRMKFNKLEGVLYTSDNLHPLSQPLVRGGHGGGGGGGEEEEIASCLPCGDGEGDECCVCLDATKTTTPCGHKLCVMCWGNIRMIRRRLPCPICRENLRQREKLAHLFPPGFIGLDNLHADFYDGGGGGDGGGDVDLVGGGVRGGRITGIYNENTGNIVRYGDGDNDDDSDSDSDDDSENNDLYFWEDYDGDGERGDAVDDEASETDDNIIMRELARVG